MSAKNTENKQLVKHLNIILRNELTAINQYFLHSKILAHEGFTKYAVKQYEESIDEMKHADKLAERILFINGLPNFQTIGKVNIGKNPEEMLKNDLAMEEANIIDLRNALQCAEESKDYGSQELLEQILLSEEGHVLWIEQQLKLLSSLGKSNYYQTLV